MNVYRSLLYMPGHKYDWMVKAPKYGADALIFDLDDAVPPSLKVEARQATSNAVAALRGGPDLFVRLSPWGDGRLIGDLLATVQHGLKGVVLSRTQDPTEVRSLDLLLSELEHERGLAPGEVEIVPLCEDAGSLRQAYEIFVASPRIRRIFGVGANPPGGDINLSLGYEWTEDGLETLYLAEKLVMDARAASITNLITGVVTDVRDHDLLRRQMRASKRLGANGAAVIHPAQVPIVNEIFSPTSEEVLRARQLLEALAEARARGESAIVHDGRMVDAAHGRSSLEVLRKAESYGMQVGAYPRSDGENVR